MAAKAKDINWMTKDFLSAYLADYTVPVNASTVKRFQEVMQELRYIYKDILRLRLAGFDVRRIANSIEMPIAKVTRRELQGIRFLRSPKYYYKVLDNFETFNKLGKLKSISVFEMDLTTRTARSLSRAGLNTAAQVYHFINIAPEFLAYIHGVGPLGMAEISHHFQHDNVDYDKLIKRL